MKSRFRTLALLCAVFAVTTSIILLTIILMF